MENILNKKSFTILIILSMISFPIAELIGVFLKRKFFYQEELLTCIGLIYTCIIICYSIKLLHNKSNVNNRFVLSDFFVIVSMFFCIISIIFSKNLKKSILGEYAYSETPFQVLGYFSLFFISTLISDEYNRKKIFNTFLILGIFESIIAFLQNFSMWPISSLFDSNWHTEAHLAFGFTEHCNYYATLGIVFTAISGAKFIYEKNKKYSIIYFIISILACISTFFTYTRIAWVGIFSVVFGILFIEFFILKKGKDSSLLKKHLKKFILLSVSFFICFLVIGLISGQLIEDVSNSKKELNSDFENFGNKRGTIWKVGLNSLKYYPLTGVGFDNYRYSFEIYPESFGWSQNKGHNEYIHTLVTQGIPSGINYLIFAFYCCYFPFKKILKKDSEFGKSDLTKIFLVALFAYLVQALFNSSVTNVAPYKWILMGLLLPRIEQKNLLEIKLFKKNK